MSDTQKITDNAPEALKAFLRACPFPTMNCRLRSVGGEQVGRALQNAFSRDAGYEVPVSQGGDLSAAPQSPGWSAQVKSVHLGNHYEVEFGGAEPDLPAQAERGQMTTFAEEAPQELLELVADLLKHRYGLLDWQPLGRAYGYRIILKKKDEASITLCGPIMPNAHGVIRQTEEA
jgi:hypothetical protein